MGSAWSINSMDSEIEPEIAGTPTIAGIPARDHGSPRIVPVPDTRISVTPVPLPFTLESITV